MLGLKLSRLAAGIWLGGVLVFTPAFPSGGTLNDGTYRGKYSFISVEVTVTGGRITAIEMTRHGGGGEKYAELVRPLFGQMVEKQSTEVDTITGATTSSNHLKKAVANALRKAALPD